MKSGFIVTPVSPELLVELAAELIEQRFHSSHFARYSRISSDRTSSVRVASRTSMMVVIDANAAG